MLSNTVTASSPPPPPPSVEPFQFEMISIPPLEDSFSKKDEPSALKKPKINNFTATNMASCNLLRNPLTINSAFTRNPREIFYDENIDRSNIKHDTQQLQQQR